DIKRLEGHGARLLEGPIQVPNGPRIAFMWAPDDVRVELIEPRKGGGGGGCGSAPVAAPRNRLANMAGTQWFYWALWSAVFAALTAIFAKLGLEGVDSDLATLV